MKSHTAGEKGSRKEKYPGLRPWNTPGTIRSGRPQEGAIAQVPPQVNRLSRCVGQVCEGSESSKQLL